MPSRLRVQVFRFDPDAVGFGVHLDFNLVEVLLLFGVLDGVHLDFLPIPGHDPNVAIDILELDLRPFVQRVGLVKFLAQFRRGKHRERAHECGQYNEGPECVETA